MSDWRNKRQTEPTRNDLLKRLEELKQAQGIIWFCTNPMSDRGFTYQCRIEKDGHATVLATQKWWSREYKDSQERIGEDLGEVKVYWVGGNSFTLQVANMKEGRG